MSENYNSILKEKKVYKDTSSEPKHPILAKFILLGIFLSIIIIIISYIVYYNTILKSENIFLSNISKLEEKYDVIYNNLMPNYNLGNNYTLDGDINIDNTLYSYSIIKANDKLKRTISNKENNITYYYDGNINYLKTSNLNNTYINTSPELYKIDYYNQELNEIKENPYNYIYNILLNDTITSMEQRLYNIDNYNNIINNIKTNFTNNTKDNYIKKFYIDDGRPIVEISLVLTKEKLNQILENTNLLITDDMDISIIMKNDAVMNDIKNIKIIINNKTKDKRVVINYNEEFLTYTDNNGIVNKFILSDKVNGFNLKYYKNDILYSVLSGEEDNNNYKYIYQVIDKKYNISLDIINKDNIYQYQLKSNINDKVSNIIMTNTYKEIGIIDEDITNIKKESSLELREQQLLISKITDILSS